MTTTHTFAGAPARTGLTTTGPAEVHYLVHRPGTDPAMLNQLGRADVRGRPARLEFVLAQICSVRLPPTHTPFVGVDRVPPLSCVGGSAGSPTVTPVLANWVAEMDAQPRLGLSQALAGWVEEASGSDRVLIDDGSLPVAAVLGLATAHGRTPRTRFAPPVLLSEPGWLDDGPADPHCVLPGARGSVIAATAAAAEDPDARWVTDGLAEMVGLRRGEVEALLRRQPRADRYGAEVELDRPHPSRWLRRSRADPAQAGHEHAETNERVLLPPWLTGEGQAMVHTAALAAKAAWAAWFDGVDGRSRQFLWPLTDPELDPLLLPEQAWLPMHSPALLAAALHAPVEARGTVEHGRILDAPALRRAAGSRPYRHDPLGHVRQQAAAQLAHIPSAARRRLQEGWLADHGQIDHAALSETFEDPFSRTELALPLLRTMGVDSWLRRLDPVSCSATPSS